MKLRITLFIVLFSTMSFAQQIALTSQYMLNEMSINPAAAGLRGNVQLGASFRRQWAGIDQAPVTQTVWGQGSLKYNFGIGGSIYNDVTGPTRRTGFSPTLAYKLKLNSDYVLSFGVGASFTQFYLDQNRIQTENPNDIAVLQNSNNKLIPDANAGLMLASKKLFVGISAWHLIQSKRDLFDIQKNVVNTLDRTYCFMGGYTFELSPKLDLTPSTVVRLMGNAPFTFDMNASLTYDKTYWGGVSYRFRDAIALMVGARVGPVRIGYSYDITTSALSKYNSGSHELFLGIDILKGKDKGSWKRRNRVYSTFSNF